MSVPAWHEEPIRKTHDREAFDCGEAALNEFLKRYARRSHDLGGAKTFLAIDDADEKTKMLRHSYLQTARAGFISIDYPDGRSMPDWRIFHGTSV